MLILFVILVPIIFGLGALVLDLGMASYVRTSMQAAADAGAMEGMRSRDDADLASDASKREQVAFVVSQQYDDDGDLTDDVMELGAGKEANFVAANPNTSNANERRTLDGPTFSPYKPELATNLIGTVPDLPEGDMLGGTYDATQRHDEGYNAVSPYLRDDFDSALGAADFTAFLVRLRRSIKPDGLNSPFDQELGVSTSGPTIPLLFGRLSAIKAGDPGTGYSARHNGITARATGIAQAVPAMMVGPTIPAFTYDGGTMPLTTVVGLAPFAIDLAWWNSRTTGVTNTGIIWTIPPLGNSGDLLDGVTVIGHTIGVWRSSNALISIDTVISLESDVGIPALPYVNPKNNTGMRVRMQREVMSMNSFVAASTFDYNVTRGVDATTADVHPDNIGAYLMDFLCVGDPIVTVDRPGADDAPGVDTRAEIIGTLPPVVYVPLYVNLGAPWGERIVGFGAATIQFDGLPANNDVLTFRREASTVAPRNASATLRYPVLGFPDYSVDPVPWDALFTTGRNTIAEPLLAPASVRSYSK